VVAGMKWLIEMLIRTRRMRGLSEAQLRDLIESAKDPEALKLLKRHLESGNFKFSHIEKLAPELIEKCTERAKELLWKESMPVLKERFITEIIERMDWL
jgi:regulator of RNase E activity RraB